MVTSGLLMLTAWAIHRDLAGTAAPAVSDAPPIAIVGTVVEEAKRRPRAALVWDPVVTGNAVWEGDGIFVPDDAAAEVRFDDGTVLSLAERSLVIVDRPEETDATAPLEISVRAGSVTGKAGAAGVRMQVGGSTARMAAGTAATVGEGAGGETRVTVHDGRALVSDSGGGTVEVGRAQRTVIDDGRASAALDLPFWLEAPAPGERVYFAGQEATVRFGWSGKPGRRVLELSTDRVFSRPFRSVPVTGHEASVDALPAGTYFWRVRAQQGGDVSDERSLVLVRDVPPAPVRPARGQVLYLPGGQSTTFAWTAVPGVRRYTVQVSAGASTSEPALEREVEGTSMRFGGDLPEGVYSWRVRSLAEERGESPYSVAVPFRLLVEPLPRAPRLYDPEVELLGTEPPPPEPNETNREPITGGVMMPPWGVVAHLLAAATARTPSASILLRWESIPGIERYVIQIAEDESFNRIVVTEEVDQPYFRWNNVSKRTHWWRVRSIDAKGREGPFGRPRKVGAVLAPPALTAPADGASFAIGGRLPTIRLTWEGSRIAAKYEVSLALDEMFTKPLETVRARQATATWRPPRSGRFWWRVRAADATGVFADYSKARAFDVYLGTPPLLRPAPGATFFPGPTPIRLEVGSIATANAYELQIAKPGEFATPLQATTAKTPAAEIEANLVGGLVWRARAVAGRDRHSRWSEPRPLIIGLATPVLTAPQPNAAIGFRSPESETRIAWEAVSAAERYEVVIARPSSGEEVARRTVSEPAISIAGLPVGEYAVRVIAEHGELTSAPDAPPALFSRVALPPLRRPVPTAPDAGARIFVRGTPPPLRLTWGAVDGATAYDVEVARLDTADQQPAEETWQRQRAEQSELEIEDLEHGFYAWRVRAVDDDGLPGGFGDTARFYYGAPLPARVEIEVTPDPVELGAEEPASIGFRVLDETGGPVAGVELVASADRGELAVIADVGDGTYRAAYRPPRSNATGGDTLFVTAPGGLAVTHRVALRNPRGLFSAGAGVGLATNFGGVTSPSVQIEGGVRLRVLGGDLTAFLRAGYRYGAIESAGSPRAKASQHAVPVALGVRVALPRLGVVDPYLGAAALVGVLHGRVSVGGSEPLTRTALGAGAEAAIGAAFGLGPGGLFVEARYGWMRRSDGTFTFDGGGLSPVVGYRIES